MRRLRYISTFALLTLAFASAAQSSALDEASLNQLLVQFRQTHELPGIRAAVLGADGVLIRGVAGLADKEAGIDLDHSVGMPGGSTGKMFVAALTLLLIEDGVLSLDDPVTRWLPGLTRQIPDPEQIRLHHLLSHTSGIADYPDTWRFQFSMIWRAIRQGSARFTPAELIAMATSRGLQFKPGDGYAYTDAGYLLLGQVIEAATTKPYFDLLQDRIIEPAGLTDIRPQDHSVLANITPGYTRGARNLKDDGRMRFDPVSEWTGGGLVTTPTMLVQFMDALVSGKIVSDDSLQIMLTRGWRDPASPEQYYGLGLFIDTANATVGHGGMWPGYRTHVTAYQDSGVIVALQTNRDGPLDMQSLVDQIANLAQ